MAVDYNQLTSISREKVLPGIVDAITTSSPTLEELFKNVQPHNGGTQIERIVRYAQNPHTYSYAGLEPLTTLPVNTRTRAKWDWKQYYHGIGISNIDIAKNGGEGKIIDLMDQEMTEAREDFSEKLATHIWADYVGGTTTGNNGKDIDTIIGATDDGGAVSLYGGIDRSTHSWFSGNEVAAGGALSLAKMREAFGRASDNGDRPNLIVTTTNGEDAYEGMLTATIQFMANTGRASSGDLSVDRMTFRGARIIGDRHAPTQKMFFLNTKYLKFHTLKHPKFPTDRRGFILTDFQRPTHQDGEIGYLLWWGNLVNDAPRRQAVLTGVTNATQY